MRIPIASALIAAAAGVARGQGWDGLGQNAQHTALSAIASQPLQAVHWETPVDLDPQYASSGDLYIHYGSPVITTDNTVIVPVKTGKYGGFELNAYNGATGSLLWSQGTDYRLPASGYSWTPPYSGSISGSTLYYAGDGGTIYERGSLDSSGSVTPTQIPFYGSLATYEANAAAYNAGVAISTPITTDAKGDVYFGYQTNGSAPGGLTSGIARISASGAGTFFEASQLQVGGVSAGMNQVVMNCAPALSKDGSSVYVAMSTGNFGMGRLVELNATTLAPEASVEMMDPKTGGAALLPNDGTASPLIGPDGDVYMGVYDDYGTSRGWMEHYSANLSVTKPAGGFGWDDTASIVPASMVPSYHGTSSYLIMTKYNNYADPGTGGNGQNMLAILDPNATETDTRYNSNGAGGATIMKTVETILGPTPDANFDTQYPGAVHEWCDNSAVVDPATDSVLVNSEDGNLYRWNLLTNTLSETVNITNGLGEAYTPTEIGPDGTVYAINNATLWAVGASSASTVYSSWSATGGGSWTGGSNWSAAIPTNAGDVATFDSTISGPSVIELNANWTVETVNFYSSFSYTIAQGSSGTLTLNNGSSSAQINDLYGNHTISAPVWLASNTTIAVGQSGNVLTISGNIGGGGGITLAATATALSAGTVVFDGVNSYGGGTTVTGGTLVVGVSGALPNGDVTITGGTLQLGAGTGLAQMTSLSISGAGVLDVNNNHVILSYSGSSPISTIAGYIKSGYNSGAWNGPGIISTAARVPTNGHPYGLGYADGADGIVSGLSSSQIEVMYTLLGDANLDGLVNAADFSILAANFNQTVTGWDQGDFNYDGLVNAADFLDLVVNFNQGASGAASVGDVAALDAFAAANGLLADVPEPGCAGMTAMAGLGMLRRRRRARQ
ncbi:MAG: dockerin type I repeat-containing protein [Tepidisphaeraceae bacterium]